jgi:hypothetical protein
MNRITFSIPYCGSLIAVFANIKGDHPPAKC